jgi:hypothetical protein
MPRKPATVCTTDLPPENWTISVGSPPGYDARHRTEKPSSGGGASASDRPANAHAARSQWTGPFSGQPRAAYEGGGDSIVTIA